MIFNINNTYTIYNSECPTLSSIATWGNRSLKCGDKQLFRNIIVMMTKPYFSQIVQGKDVVGHHWSIKYSNNLNITVIAKIVTFYYKIKSINLVITNIFTTTALLHQQQHFFNINNNFKTTVTTFSQLQVEHLWLQQFHIGNNSHNNIFSTTTTVTTTIKYQQQQ